MLKRITSAALLWAVASQGWAYTVLSTWDESASLLEGDGRQSIVVILERDLDEFGNPIDEGFCEIQATVRAGPIQEEFVDDEATPSIDYIPRTIDVTLTLQADELSTSTTFDVTVIDDTIAEPTEFFATQVESFTVIDCGTDPLFAVGGENLVPIFDDDQPNPGNPAFDPATLTVNEGAGSAVVTVNRVGGSSGSLTVDYVTVDGTAESADDYTSVSGILAWEDGDTSPRQITVPILEDTLVEGDETFDIILTSSANPNAPVTGTVTIIDNDTPGLVQFAVTDLVVDETAGTVSATVVRSGTLNGDLSVDFATVDGSATAGEDYTATAGTLTWGDGDATDRTITVTILEDEEAEEDETFSIVLSNLVGDATLGPNSTATVTISASDTARDIGSISSLTPNQRSLAEWFDEVCPRLGGTSAPTEGQQDLIGICQDVRDPDTTDDQVRQALDAINPDEIFAAATSALRLTSAQHGNLSQRLNALRSGASGVDVAGLNLSIDGRQISGTALQELFNQLTGGAASADDATWGRWGAFVNGRLSTGEKDDTANEAGFDYDLYGISVGVDYRIRQNLIAGVAAGFGGVESKYQGDRGSLDIDSWNVAAFVTYFREESFYADALLTYGRNDYDSQRRILFDTGSGTVDRTTNGTTDGTQISFGTGIGWDFSRNALTYGPHLGVYYYNVEVDGFRESGAGGLDLAIGDQSVTSLTGNAGLHASYAVLTSWGALIPNVRVDWVREFEDSSESMSFQFVNDPFVADPGNPSPTITLTSDRPDNNYLLWSAGVSAQFIMGVSGFVNYQTYTNYANFSIDEWNFGLRWEKTF